MKRTAIKRGSGPARKALLKRSNPKRRARMYARNFGDRADAVRSMPCLVAKAWSPPAWFETAPRCAGPVQAAHARARGMGGCKGDRRELVPLCDHHHQESGEARTSQRAKFEEKYGLSLTISAQSIAERLDAEGYE